MLSSRASVRLIFVPPLILFLGLVLTYALQDVARESARQVLHDEFDFRFNVIIQNIHERMANCEQVLEGAVDLYAASNSVGCEETEAQLAFLRVSDCDSAQGYLFSPPVPAQLFVQFIQNDFHWPT